MSSFSLLCVLVSVVCSVAGQSVYVPYYHNYADEKGVSHLATCSFDNFTLANYLPNTPPFYIDSPVADGRTHFQMNVLPGGWAGGWHKDPVVQLVYITAGAMKWTTMSGQSRVFNASSGASQIYLGNDQLSQKGHLSACLSASPCVLSFIQFPYLDPKDYVSRPCFLH